MKNKQEILDAVAKLLNTPDCVVRIQREMLPDPAQKHDAQFNQFVVGKRVTIIIVGSQP